MKIRTGGHQINMLQGPIWNQIPRFAFPVAATAILEQLFNASDIAVVGIFRIGLPAGIQSAVFSVANIVIQSSINSLGTVVMAASSAAYNIEIITYDILNSFSQACTTFVGQNYGAGQIRRCRKTLLLCIVEGLITLGAAIALILFFGRTLLSIFNSDPDVVSVGYIRLMTIVTAHVFSLLYEVLSGYLRGFGISLVPAVLTIIGVCGIRIMWIQFVFPHSRTFQTIMNVYPISLSATAAMIFVAVMYYIHIHKRKGEAGQTAD